ncbi:MAG TPA: hypothetical protein VIY29_29365, partial [Ktedonobacteraceae bacterium]
MALKRFNECGEKGDEAFGTDTVGDVPGQKQRVLDLWPILARTGALQYLLHLFCMIATGAAQEALAAALAALLATQPLAAARLDYDLAI